MKGNTGLALFFGFIILVLLGVIFLTFRTPQVENTASTLHGLFLCADDKWIDAVFEDDTATLSLSDGRSLPLPRAISGSGARYANEDESIVFWNKGNTAFIQEQNRETFTKCIEALPDPGGLPEAYADRTYEFTIRYPEGYAINPSYVYEGLGPKKMIAGVSFTIPPTMATGTNLSSDTRLSVERLATSTEACLASRFLLDPVSLSAMNENGTEYSVADVSDAGAGNRYEEWIYALVGTNPCTAVRYFIHSTAIGNYPEDTATEFDRAGLTAQFDAIRHTLVLGQ